MERMERGACLLRAVKLIGRLELETLAALCAALDRPSGARGLHELLRAAYALPDDVREELVKRMRAKAAELYGLAVVRTGG